jgi:hypothetical protein
MTQEGALGMTREGESADVQKVERVRRANLGTGTGFACAKLSEVPPPVAKAPVVGMTRRVMA